MEHKDLCKLIGNRLRELRKVQGLRQEDMENRGISYKYYQRIEAGRVNLTLKSLSIIASALNTTVPELFRFPFPEPSSPDHAEGIISNIASLIKDNDQQTLKLLGVIVDEIVRWKKKE